ncbi:MAG: xanthine phosphoribosyltransferase [Anaerolineae bacterium]
MKALIDRIKSEGTYLGGGILKVDGFVNHQIDPALTMAIGSEFVARFARAGVDAVTKVVTAEVSGIAPALATAQALGVPMVYARKHRPITMPDGFFLAEAPSHTKGGVVRLMISPEYLSAEDRVLLIDDFLATGLTIGAIAALIRQSRATLCGIGCVIEKVFEGGRDYLADLDVPIIVLARVDLNGDSFTVF